MEKRITENGHKLDQIRSICDRLDQIRDKVIGVSDEVNDNLETTVRKMSHKTEQTNEVNNERMTKLESKVEDIGKQMARLESNFNEKMENISQALTKFSEKLDKSE